MERPGGGASPPNDARRNWLRRVQAATGDALAIARGSDDPAQQMLASDLELLSLRIAGELEDVDHGEPSAPEVS